MAIGISYNDFWDMNPSIVMIHAKANAIRQEQCFEYDNYMAYIQGAYILEALNATVGNMFRNKGQKPNEYPDKPYSFNNEEYTEDELDRQRKAFWESLKVAQANFELEKGSSK